MQEITFSGTARLLNLMFICVLMLISIQLSMDVKARASIRDSLDSRFHFEEIKTAHNKESLWEQLTGLEKHSLGFFPSSHLLYKSTLDTVQVCIGGLG